MVTRFFNMIRLLLIILLCVAGYKAWDRLVKENPRGESFGGVIGLEIAEILTLVWKRGAGFCQGLANTLAYLLGDEN